LRKVLVGRRFEVAVRLEIYDGPTDEITGILVKGEVDCALNKAAVIPLKEDWRLAAELAFAGAGCGSSQNWMRHGPADRGNGSLDFLFCRANQSPVKVRCSPYRS
jgi:hypothetical protein